ncbi:MAG: DUF4416 family protein [Candidatus Omnitrophica bacterium]|nr:DUF4416 family protein [Candidatus Omnitrophota bacterium]
MGILRDPHAVKLVVGFIFKDVPVLEDSESALYARFGAPDAQSPIYTFMHTDYYRREMGDNLRKKFVSFRKLISPGSLASIKRFTNTVESRFSHQGTRRINIDPGYLDSARVVLASTKDFVHRVYIGRKIFAEVSLFYRDKQYRAWKWTYPDFRQKKYRDFFGYVRDIYTTQLKEKP